MPELAEVETIKRYLEKHIVGETIITYQQGRDNLRYQLSFDLKENIENNVIKSLHRRAKYLLIELSNNKLMTIHLGMSGRFTIKNSDYILAKHDHIAMTLQSGRKLIFNDPRRFGMIYCFDSNKLHEQKFIKHLGPEPLGDEFNEYYLHKVLANRQAPIKNVLMDNNVLVGVGNIYAAESLFTAKIHPRRSANLISAKECQLLVQAIKNVLTKAIDAGGTTLRDFVGGNSEPGYFKQELNVYGREQLPCKLCEWPIITIRQAGRTTFYCDNCQK